MPTKNITQDQASLIAEAIWDTMNVNQKFDAVMNYMTDNQPTPIQQPVKAVQTPKTDLYMPKPNNVPYEKVIDKLKSFITGIVDDVVAMDHHIERAGDAVDTNVKLVDARDKAQELVNLIEEQRERMTSICLNQKTDEEMNNRHSKW